MADQFLDQKIGVPVVLPNSRPWTAFTPVLSGTGSMTFTCTGFYRDWLDTREVWFQCSGNNVASGAGSTIITMSLPPSSTITTGKLPQGTVGFLNQAGWIQTYGIESTGNFAPNSSVIPFSTTSMAFLRPATNTYYQTGNLNTATQMFISGHYFIPIDELAGGYSAYGAGQALANRMGLISSEDAGSFTGTLSGTTVAGTGTIYYQKLGRTVILTTVANLFSYTKDGTVGPVSINGIPAGLRPTVSVGTTPIPQNYNNIATVGNARVTPAGALVFYRSGADDPMAAGTTGVLPNFTITYQII